MNNKHKNIDSNKETFWNWLNRQNVFAVFFVLFAIFYFSHRVYANFISPNKNEANTEQIYNNLEDAENTLVIPEFSPTSTPNPTAKPTATSFPTPTLDPDPVIDCTTPIDCGGKTTKQRRSDCVSKGCCDIGDGVFEILSKDDCNKKQIEFNRLQQEEYEQKMKAYLDALQSNNENYEQYLKELEKFNKQMEEYNQTNQTVPTTNNLKPMGYYGTIGVDAPIVR